jgi:hypothetical protein
MNQDQLDKAFFTVSIISNALGVEIASMNKTRTCITFDLNGIDDVEYWMESDTLMIAESGSWNDQGEDRVTRDQRRLLYGIAYECGLTIEEFE